MKNIHEVLTKHTSIKWFDYGVTIVGEFAGFDIVIRDVEDNYIVYIFNADVLVQRKFEITETIALDILYGIYNMLGGIILKYW